MKITNLFIALLLFCCGCAPMIPYRHRPTLVFEVDHTPKEEKADYHSNTMLRSIVKFQV